MMVSKSWMAKTQRMARAFEGWWARYGHDFAVTPEPRDDIRKRIAEHAFQAGWKVRSARAQKKALRIPRQLKRITT